MAEIPIRLLQCRVANTGVLKIDRIGSGVGVMLYSGTKKTGAGLHVLAPRSGSVASQNPVMYADTAIPHVLRELESAGVKPPFSVAIAGGGSMLGEEKATGTGRKVVDAVREALAKAGLTVKMDETGGTKIRSMALDVDGGRIKIT